MNELMRVQAALSYIDSNDREVWVSVGNAIKGEFGENGFDTWLDWSADASSFNKKSAVSVWKSLKRLVVPIGYIFKIAIAHGYQVDKTEYQAPTAAQLAERKAKQDALREKEALERSLEAESALTKSHIQWSSANKTGQSAYLARKKVTGENIRYLPDGSILIPMMHYELPRESAFVGVQMIKPDGTKLFPKGVAKSGSACRLGELNSRILAVCEGYATACSIRFGTDYKLPVYVAFDAGNLIKVVAILRSLYPNTHILVCADNDQKTKGNPGIKAGKQAVRANKNTSIIYPIFAISDKKSSDFNDLFLVRGAAVLKQQFALVLSHFLPESERV